jgi:RNA polymerase sigma-70 factor, ECF subfamily
MPAGATVSSISIARATELSLDFDVDKLLSWRCSRVPIESIPVGQQVAKQAGMAVVVDRDSDVSGELRLLRETAGGSEAAYRALVKNHLRPLLAIGRRMLGETAEAEDMAQEALLRLWRGAGQIEIGPAGVRPWLNRVAANLCLDRLRARKSAPVTQDEMPDVGVAASQQRGLEEVELARRVEAALQQLPERQRLALVMFHYQGLSQGEAADAMEITQDALESLLARARRSLKAELAEEWKALLPDAVEQDGKLSWKTGHGHADQ